MKVHLWLVMSICLTLSRHVRARAVHLRLDEAEATTYSAGPSRQDKMLVVARQGEDSSWVELYLGDIPYVVYQVDDPVRTKGMQHGSLANKGNEAMAYLQFILENYHSLPEHLVFIHGHRSSWHMEDYVPIIRNLQWDSYKYANLRHKNSPEHKLSWTCGPHLSPEWSFHDCNWEGAHLHPGNLSIVDFQDMTAHRDSLELFQQWEDMFQGELGPCPKEIRGPCCSSFLVARERILAHPRVFYVRLMAWLLTSQIESHRISKLLEYTWHIIFGEAPVLEAVPKCSLLAC